MITTAAIRTSFSPPIFENDQINKTSQIELTPTESISEADLTLNNDIQDQSVTVDCLRIPLQSGCLKRLSNAHPSDEHGFYALAQNIFQFSLKDRIKIYEHLKLNDKEKENLEVYCKSNHPRFQEELKNHIQNFSNKISENLDESILIQIADELEINLVVLKQEQSNIEIIYDHFSTALYTEEDHPCFQSKLCVTIGEQKGLFKKNHDGTFEIICRSQSASNMREVYAQFAQIRRAILAIHNDQQAVQEIACDSYQYWFQTHIHEGVLNAETALIELLESETYIQNFSENILKPEIRNYPLAVIEEKSVAFAERKSLARLIQQQAKSFKLNDENYVIKRTSGDGACALHAILGEEINGVYRYPGTEDDAGARVKRAFTYWLRFELDEENRIIIHKFIEAINSLIRGILRDPSAKMLFEDSEEGRRLKRSWEELQSNHSNSFKDLKEQEAADWCSLVKLPDSPIFSQIMEEVTEVTTRGARESPFFNRNPEQVLQLLNENPARILDFIDAQPVAFIGLLSGQKREHILETRLRRENTRAQLGEDEAAFILRDDLIHHYITTLNSSSEYYLNTQEVSLAAHLFDKKVQVVASRRGGIERCENLMNEDGGEDLIVIYHEGNHFEHCQRFEGSFYEEEKELVHHAKVTQYEAIDLSHLAKSSLNNYHLISLIQALDNVLEFIDHKKLGDALFSILYGERSREEMSKEYNQILSQVMQSLGIQEKGSLNDEQIVQKITSIQLQLQSQLPKELRPHRSFVLDPRFAILRELESKIATFIHKKKYVERLAQEIHGHKRGKIKAVLRNSEQFTDLAKVQTAAESLEKLESVDKVTEFLFREFYGKDYSQEREEYTKALQAIDQKFFSNEIESIDDDNILDEITQLLLLHTEEKNREYREKSLDQLCSEYAELNGIDSRTIQRIKGQILNIRLLIEDIKKNKTLPIEKDQQYPIALIADICVKIENEFGDMLRDTQLLAILSMLGCSDSRGGLSQLETGEGKTYVIVALAIIKSKQGEEVDVITSSATLAKRDVEKFKAFYQEQFGIFCSHNCDSDVGMMANPSYQMRSIVYGTTASFEGDSLRSEFYQADTFNGRKRGIAILDEADSALLDKASWLCQISDSVAGMSTVRPLLYYIWALVLKKLDEVKDEKIETKEAYEAFLEKIKEEVCENFQSFFSGGDQSFVIPDHLKEFTKYRISYWIESALRAIFYTHDREYNACKILKKITPIDYANTGEWEKDVQWEDALHQFIQMKTGIGVETETLTKSFMSNYTLMNKYRSIFGFSGTVGEGEESETYKELYSLTASKIPKFKICHYEEKLAWISPKREFWLDSLYTDVVTDGLEENPFSQDNLPLCTKNRSRATLIICKTIADVKDIETHFKKKGIHHSDIFTYTNGDEDKANIKEAVKGKIIIATNLSGRGTDIDASSIEGAGGLHVIFSFLPANKRIQDQGFGRTARKGLSGTGRLVIQQDELKEYHLIKEEDPKNPQGFSYHLTYDSIMDGRNLREKFRLESLRSNGKKSLIAKQVLFQSFQDQFHCIPTNFQVEPRLVGISSHLLELYKSYVLDEWAIFLDRVSKNLQEPSLESFEYALDLNAMIQKNDLYKMQYINASIDVDDRTIRQEADAFYKERARKIDLTGAFACYNRVFITLKNKASDIEKAKTHLQKASEILEKGEAYEKGILGVQHKVCCPDGSEASQEDIEGTPLLRLILTMKTLVKRNLEELEKLAEDYSELKVSFTNPYDLKENPSSSTEKNDDDEKGYTIPDDLMHEAIKLGLKGPLKLEGKGSFWQAILCAIISVIVAIVAIAAIAFSGGVAAPLVSLLGGEIVFGVIAGAVAGAAINGAISAIKGAVNGDFSFKNFGKEVLTGLVAGAVGGGIGAGLAGAVGGVLRLASPLVRVGVNAGIGAVAGAGAGAGGYLVNAGLHGRTVSWGEFGKAALYGAVGGGLAGGVVGVVPYGVNNIRWNILGGAGAGFGGNAAIQGIQIAMHDRDRFDLYELFENGLVGGVQDGVMARAQKYGAKQNLKQNQRMVAHPEEGVNKGRVLAEFEDIPLGVQKRVLETPERMKELDDLNLEIAKERQIAGTLKPPHSLDKPLRNRLSERLFDVEEQNHRPINPSDSSINPFLERDSWLKGKLLSSIKEARPLSKRVFDVEHQTHRPINPSDSFMKPSFKRKKDLRRVRHSIKKADPRKKVDSPVTMMADPRLFPKNDKPLAQMKSYDCVPTVVERIIKNALDRPISKAEIEIKLGTNAIGGTDPRKIGPVFNEYGLDLIDMKNDFFWPMGIYPGKKVQFLGVVNQHAVLIDHFKFKGKNLARLKFEGKKLVDIEAKQRGLRGLIREEPEHLNIHYLDPEKPGELQKGKLEEFKAIAVVKNRLHA